jgi:hypothetical protein
MARFALLVLVAFSLLNIPEGHAMGAFDPIVLFSEVHGTVLMNGQPVRGAQLVQKVLWSDNADKNPVRLAVTDEHGAFHFPVIERSAGLLRLIPSQPMMLQTLLIRYQDEEYIAWRHGKDSYDANTELEGRPIALICELTRKPDFEGTHYGICKVQ